MIYNINQSPKVFSCFEKSSIDVKVQTEKPNQNIYIYIYTERERKRGGEKDRDGERQRRRKTERKTDIKQETKRDRERQIYDKEFVYMIVYRGWLSKFKIHRGGHHKHNGTPQGLAKAVTHR